MNDPRPSENQDQPLQFPEMKRRGFFDDVPALGRDFFMEPSAAEAKVDHRLAAEEILAHRASPNDPHGLAVAHALLALTEQQRIANLIAIVGMTAHTGVAIAEYDNFAVEDEIRKGLDL